MHVDVYSPAAARGCSCAPERAACPEDPGASAWADALPPALVAWSPVTGECLPWGPGGPVGTAAGALLFASAAQGLRGPVSGVAGRARTPPTRRPEEVERGLRRLDGLAKRNAPFAGALAVLLLSVPRNPAGLLLGLAAAAGGLAAGLRQAGGPGQGAE